MTFESRGSQAGDRIHALVAIATAAGLWAVAAVGIMIPMAAKIPVIVAATD